MRLNRRLSRVQSLAVANDADGQPCAYVYCASADVAAVPLSETTAAVPWEDSADATDTDASPAPYHDVPGHIFGTECRCVSVAGGQLVASVGNDGVVLARATADGACLAQPAVGMGHSDSSLTLAPPPLQNVQDSTSCHIAAGIDGQSFITSTRHGREVLLWKWDSAPQDDVATAVVAAAMTVLASTPCTRARHALAAATPSASVATPDPTTTTVVRGPTTSTDARGMAVATRSRTEARQREALAGRVARVREKVTALIESNETKDALERLERDEFQLDLAERQRLVAEGDVQLRALREEIDLKILAQQFLRWRIKKMCWDSMRVRGTCVFTFNQQLEVRGVSSRSSLLFEFSLLPVCPLLSSQHCVNLVRGNPRQNALTLTWCYWGCLGVQLPAPQAVQGRADGAQVHQLCTQGAGQRRTAHQAGATSLGWHALCADRRQSCRSRAAVGHGRGQGRGGSGR